MSSSLTIEIGGEPTPLAAALAAFLKHDTSTSPQTVSVSLDATWQTCLDGSVTQASPMFFVPRRSIDWDVDLDGSNARSLVSVVQDAVADWRRVEDPLITPGAAIVLRVTFYVTGEPSRAVILRYDAAWPARDASQ